MLTRLLTSKFACFGIVTLVALGSFAIGYQRWRLARLPDLAGCTRVELQFRPSVLHYVYPFEDKASIFTSLELERMGLLEVIVLDNPRDIRELALAVRSRLEVRGGLGSRSPEAIGQKDSILMDWYRADKSRLSTVWRDGPTNPALLTPVIRPFWLRVECKRNIEALRWRQSFDNDAKTYPQVTNWCDATVAAEKAMGKDAQEMLSDLVCPSGGKGRCHYAMNPDCEPNSPKDTVLLFETKAGWNQHGGPELFTFDNHDPKGGCVLLNDGTVKFIRTKEELAQLRWKP